MSENFKKDDGTGMVPPPNSAPAGAVTSEQATRKYPKQGLVVDRNRHGIRRERPVGGIKPKKTGRRKV
jgi:hypothetical protein